MRLSKAMVLGASVTAFGVFGCGGSQGDQQPVQSGYQQGQQPYGQQQQPYGQQQPQPAYGQQAQPAQAQPTYGTAAQPTQQPQQTTAQQPQAAATPAATPLDATMAAAAQPILNELAKKQAPPGAKPLGAAMVANFQPGQSIESQIQLQPGKCYTVVAAGLPPVTEVNVSFVAVSVIPGSAMVMAQDNEVGAQGVLGENPNCYKNPAPIAIPVRVVLQVAGGQGLAAAQVYEK